MHNKTILLLAVRSDVVLTKSLTLFWNSMFLCTGQCSPAQWNNKNSTNAFFQSHPFFIFAAWLSWWLNTTSFLDSLIHTLWKIWDSNLGAADVNKPELWFATNSLKGILFSLLCGLTFVGELLGCLCISLALSWCSENSSPTSDSGTR